MCTWSEEGSTCVSYLKCKWLSSLCMCRCFTAYRKTFAFGFCRWECSYSSASLHFLHCIHDQQSALWNTTKVTQSSRIVSYLLGCISSANQKPRQFRAKSMFSHCISFFFSHVERVQGSFVQLFTCMHSVTSDTEVKTLIWHQWTSTWEARAYLLSADMSTKTSEQFLIKI